MKMRRLACVAAALVAVGCADVVGPPAATDHGSLFDDLWHQFDLHYSYFTVTRVNWDSLGAYYRPIAVSAANDVQFARVLGAMLAELKDMHVSLSAGPAGTMRYISRFDTTATYFSEVVTLGRYVRIPTSTPKRPHTVRSRERLDRICAHPHLRRRQLVRRNGRRDPRHARHAHADHRRP